MSENENYKARFIKGFNILAHNSGRHPYTVWEDVIKIIAITIQNNCSQWYKNDKKYAKVWQAREDEYLKIINAYSKKEQKLFPQMFSLLVMEFEKNPDQDLLGSIYMELGLGNKNKGQFFTPYSVCALMSGITLNKKDLAKMVHTKGFASVCDSACGAGATLVSAANECRKLFKKLNFQNHVYFVGTDVDPLVCMMCYIQLSFLGVAGYVVNTDTLAHPDVELPKELEKVWFTPIYFSDVWVMRRMFHNLDILMR